MNFGWYGNPGTPFEDYLALSFNKKHNLDTEKKIMDYFLKWGYSMEYERWKTVFDGWCEPDNLTPDRFMKYGIVNCPRDWEKVKTFIKLHKPLMYDF
jgi:hypothetical protein